MNLIERLRALFSLDERVLAEQLHPDFVRFYRNVLRSQSAFDEYVAEVRYLVKVGAFSGKRHVLDLAAGFGVTATCLRALGAQRVSCLDVVEDKISTARKLAVRLEADKLDFHLGDAASLPFDDATLDGVLIKQAISHFQFPEAIYAEVSRVLRPGGRLVILDDRNILHPEVRAETERVWEQSETGSPAELAELGLPASFTQMRRDYILRRFEAIAEPLADRLAAETRGYTFAMLEQVVPALRDGKRTDLQPVAPCINPENGVAQERLVDPRSLARDLGQLGLAARVVPPKDADPDYWTSVGGGWKGVLRRRLRNAVLGHRLLPNEVKRMPVFIVVGEKR